MIWRKDLSSIILYLFSFFLLWEWLRPLEQLTDMGNIEVFVAFILVCFLGSYFQVKWGIQFVIKFIYMMISLNQLFVGKWWTSFFRDVNYIFTRNWDQLSNEFRTLLFFILLWLMAYLIHYWILRRQRIFTFFFMTLIYITVLDAFTTYQAKSAIIRTVIFGFALMGMLTYYRILAKGNISRNPSDTRKWMFPLTGMIIFSVLVGFAAPKAAPIWPDPVAFFNSTKDGAGGVGKVGYGENDSHLGGPFVGDDTVVFKVVAKDKQYWKVETKDTYTGKGWEASGSSQITFPQGNIVPVYPIPDAVSKTLEKAEIYSYYEKNYLSYPAGILMVENGPSLFKINTNTEKIDTFDVNRKPVSPGFYQIEFIVPKYNAEDLTKATDAVFDLMSQDFGQYTRLPKGLPPRVKQLAEEITAGKTNWFDKAQAIESYFDSIDYTYDQKDVAVPGKNDDYVDQFLFETKRGYCDNFSTSMAVMLRTLGIPTRWVKGYNGGTFKEFGNDTERIYEITNNNAHAWVEVFFPNQGWVPFEPTKGFTNNVEIAFPKVNPISSNNQPAAPVKPVQRPQKSLDDNEKATTGNNTFDLKIMWINIKLFWKNQWKWIVLGLAVVGFVISYLYRIRGKWFPYYLLFYYRYKKDDQILGAAYLSLLKQLDRYGIKRKKNQTLRNYADYIDHFFSTRDMTELTAYYEQMIYNQNLDKGSWKEVRELWENLIKKTIA
jgi:transglutaminase-like putative cysteine protease